MGGKGLTDVNSFFEFYSGRQGLCFDVIWVVGTEQHIFNYHILFEYLLFSAKLTLTGFIFIYSF